MQEQRQGNGPSAMISTSALQLFHEYTGCGPTRAKTQINRDLCTVLLADTLTTGERTLVEKGRSNRACNSATITKTRCATTWSRSLSDSSIGESSPS